MINQAIFFATKAHQNQYRKGTHLPYIIHPLEVGAIVARFTEDEELISAAILHDTVEDCEHITLDDIEKQFGKKVRSIVAAESEDKTGTWVERKTRTLNNLSGEKDSQIKLIALGDKLSNIRSLYKDYIQIGDKVWERFNMKDKSKQGWYYKGLCESLKDLNTVPEYNEFTTLVALVFGEENAD